MTDPHFPAPPSRIDPEERLYLLKRAADHRRLADRTSEAGARSIHLRLQQLYDEQARLIALVDQD